MQRQRDAQSDSVLGEEQIGMAAFIIIIAAVIIIGLCLYLFIGRMTGKKSCCGEKPPKVKAKKLNNPLGKLTVRVGGMRCESCRRTLMTKLNGLDGISAKVSLENNTAVIFYERPVSEGEITEAVESAGFDVLEIRR